MIGSDPVQRRWLEVDGRVLHRLEFGGTGPLVVCLHGVTSCAWVWHHVARGLRAGHSVVACDLRGHGESGWAGPEQYGSADLATDVAAVLADLGVSGDRPVDLVGSSWGALVALALTAARPELVRRLVMVDIEPSFTQPVALDPRRPGRFADLDAAGAHWRAMNPSGPHDLIQLLAAAATRPAPDGGRIPIHDPMFLERWPFRSEDWWAALDAVDAPTLVVKAERSHIRAEVCDQMAGRLRHGQRADIPGATHVVPVDAPVALAAVLSRFL